MRDSAGKFQAVPSRDLMWIIFKIPLARISNQALNFRMRSGERCCCSRCRDDPETSGPHRDLGESRENGEHGGAAQERKQGRCDDGPASGGNPQCRRQVPKDRQVFDRGGSRKVCTGIAGRKTPDPKPGREVGWKGGPKGQVPDTGSKDLRPARVAPRGGYRMPGRKTFAERRRRKVGVGCSRRPGHASGLEGRCVANCRNGEGPKGYVTGPAQ